MRPRGSILAAVMAGWALAAVVAGCARIPESQRPLEVAVKYPAQQDLEEGIPCLSILHVPKVEGYVRQSPAQRTINGREYRGERVEVAQTLGANAPGELLFEIIARRLDQPERHIDLYVTSALRWQLIVVDAPHGKVRDGVTGREILWPYLLEPGSYNVKAGQ